MSDADDAEPLMDDDEPGEFALGRFARLHRKLLALAAVVPQREVVLRAAAATLFDAALGRDRDLTLADVNWAEQRLVEMIRHEADAERARVAARR